MIAPATPHNEKERLESLNSYEILDSLDEKEYDHLTQIASQICDSPIALISLIDTDRQWFKSKVGIGVSETPRSISFCAHAIQNPNEVMVIKDSREDERFHDNPMVSEPANVIFYAGAPLNSPEGFALGTLCVVDHKPKELTIKQLKSLRALAAQIVSLFELRKSIRLLEIKNKEIDTLNNQLNSFAHSLSHDLKTPIRGIQTIASWLKMDYESVLDEQANSWIDIIISRTDYMNALAVGMLDYAKNTNEHVMYTPFNFEEILEKIKNNFDVSKNFIFQFENCNQTVKQSEIAFKTIFQNLISNSIKYGNKEQGHITITLFADDIDFIKIVYEDNGPGIPKNYRKKVFDLFETIGEKNQNSTGIGLTTVKAIIDRMHGKIHIKDRKNGLSGICIEIILRKTD